MSRADRGRRPAVRAAPGARAEDGSVDELLDRLERAIGQLADPAAPLERLVTDYEEAVRLVAAAEARLEDAARRIERLRLATRTPS